MKLKQKTTCFVCDLDGTLCDVSKRRQFVATYPKNWEAWNAGVPYDEPNLPVLEVVNALGKVHDVVLVSGRGSEYRAETVEWLKRHRVTYSRVFMRDFKDSRPDYIIKAELADEVEKEFTILGVFDDRKSVVDMWIKRGIFVFDVAQGGGDF